MVTPPTFLDDDGNEPQPETQGVWRESVSLSNDHAADEKMFRLMGILGFGVVL